MHRLLADIVLLVHFGVVLFVVGGLGAIVLGGLLRWRWSAHPVFRVAHLSAIAFVVAQAWLGQTCPLTSWESWLRTRAGGRGYETSFVEHWIGAALFHTAPPWVFTAVYTAFGLAVVWAGWRFPARRVVAAAPP